MNAELMQLCLEIYKTELTKLEGLSRIYGSGLDLIRAIELANPVLPQADVLISSIKTYLAPFEEIRALVGDNVSNFLSNELGVNLEHITSAEQMAQNVLKLIANNYFITIRKAAALAGSQFAEFSGLYQKITAMLKWPSNAFNIFQADQIKCVQIFSQFAMLGDKLKKDVSTLYEPSHELNQVSVLFAELCSLAASYADFTQKRSDKSLAHVAPSLVPVFEAKKEKFEQQLIDLTAERVLLDQQLAILNPNRELCTLLIQATDTDEQEKLFQRWKTEYAHSNLTDDKYPQTPKEIAELTQELSCFELNYQRISIDLEQIIAQQHNLTVQLKQIQDALSRLDFAGRLERMQAAIMAKAEQNGLKPITVMKKTLPVSTFVSVQALFPEDSLSPPPKSSSPSLFKRFRAATSSTPKLTRTFSESSHTSADDLISSPRSPKDDGQSKSEKLNSLGNSSSDISSVPSSSSSSPISSKKIKSDTVKSPRLFNDNDLSSSLTVTTLVSPTIKDRINSLNAQGGIHFSMVRK